MYDPHLVETAIKILLAVAPAAVIGLEREMSGEAAGIRTHVLLAVGACLFTLAGLQLGSSEGGRAGAQVVTGVGFIGAGAMLRDRLRIKGLATAASLWVTAAVGVAAGLGAYAELASAVLVTLVVLTVIPTVQQRILPYRSVQRIEVRLDPLADADRVAESIRTFLPGFRLTGVTSPGEGNGGQVLTGESRRARRCGPMEAVSRIQAIPGVHDVDLLL